ncbi:hypothetical protein TrRE_jg12057 [Triparma retinervis]|uniref:Uncharacterized protein n=1 Tax=Triparma retinervis TaxID=2557542 RepID=A0A9W7ANH3_9STRA|nr:hypothetical protein TrRE_jg12057 [Triparma retinervis]
MGHVLLVACLIALFSLGNAQEYLALEINVDGTDHKLYLDACFDQEAVSSAVQAFMSSESSNMRAVSVLLPLTKP